MLELPESWILNPFFVSWKPVLNPFSWIISCSGKKTWILNHFFVCWKPVWIHLAESFLYAGTTWIHCNLELPESWIRTTSFCKYSESSSVRRAVILRLQLEQFICRSGFACGTGVLFIGVELCSACFVCHGYSFVSVCKECKFLADQKRYLVMTFICAYF